MEKIASKWFFKPLSFSVYEKFLRLVNIKKKKIFKRHEIDWAPMCSCSACKTNKIKSEGPKCSLLETLISLNKWWRWGGNNRDWRKEQIREEFWPIWKYNWFLLSSNFSSSLDSPAGSTQEMTYSHFRGNVVQSAASSSVGSLTTITSTTTLAASDNTSYTHVSLNFADIL